MSDFNPKDADVKTPENLETDAAENNASGQTESAVGSQNADDKPSQNADATPENLETDAANLDDGEDRDEINAPQTLQPLTEEDFDDWFDDENQNLFASKFKKVLGIFGWGKFLWPGEFAVAFGVAFVWLALSVLLLSLSFARLFSPDFVQIIFAILGSLGVLGATLAFTCATVSRFGEADLFDWSDETSQEKFLLTFFKNFGLAFVWCAALFLTIVAILNAVEACDDRAPIVGGLFAIVAWFGGALSLFGFIGSTLSIAKETTQRFHDAGFFVWDADGWRGKATRQDFLLALVNYALATTATALPYALVGGLLFWIQEGFALGFLAFFFCFLVSSLVYGPFLLPASAQRFRDLGLSPLATLLYLVVPAPYMALILVALAPAQPEEEPEFDEKEFPF